MTRELKYDSQRCLMAPALTAVQIKRFREELQMTQEEFAKEYDIPLGTLRGWEQGLHASRASAYLLRFLQETLKHGERKRLAHA